jgi:phenylalanyl-tRNA synthetase beta chain
VSAIVNDRLPWAEIKQSLDSLHLQHLEAIEFVTTYRGKQIGAGRKSLSLRARFRADRTLKHEEVDPQMHTLMETLKVKFNAEIRS